MSMPKRLIFSMLILSGLVIGEYAPARAESVMPTTTPDCCSISTITPLPDSGVDGNGVIASGVLYVCDRVHDQLLKYSIPSATQIGSIPLPFGTGPYGLAVGGDGHLYIGGYNGQVILKVSLTGGSATTLTSEIGYVRGLALDPANGDIYTAVEPFGVRILKKSLDYVDDGTFLPGTVGLVYTGIWITTGGQVYLSGQGIVLRYSQTGGYGFTAPITVANDTTLVNPFNIVLDSMGRLYVASFGNAYYNVFDTANGYAELHRCHLPDNSIGIAVDNSTGDVYLTATDQIFKARHCWSLVFPTPTPSYPGTDPPTAGQYFIYPSPARGDHATVCYTMVEVGQMELKIWNKNGELVSHVTDRKTPGTQVTPFSLAGFARGIYFYTVILNYDSGSAERSRIQKFAVFH